ncbi:MAG: hypothetical protein A2Y17_01585 [Clostridiales bacterium GWF2_38_85]|nr:MAG: hypothetical protein A2Y17_01585 [Clostridiales bacterium GWF2_38_85]HBL84800.1 hypothetical protein [Clostridiales bacterium]
MREMNCRNNKGSTMVWAIVVIFVLVIIIGSTLTAASAYYNRSLNNNYEKQAYFTSRSVVDALSSEIKSGTTNGNAILSKLITIGDSISIDNISFIGDSAKKGSTIATVELESEETIKITATTTINKKAETVTLKLSKGPDQTYPISEDFPGLTIPDDAIVVTISYPIDGYGTYDLYAKEGSAILYLNNADYYGNIFAETKTVINIENGSKFHGSIYAQSGTEFKFSKLHNKFVGLIYVKDGAVLKVNGKDYTIIKNKTSIKVTPSGMNTKFKSLLRIYIGTVTGEESWGDTVYE